MNRWIRSRRRPSSANHRPSVRSAVHHRGIPRSRTRIRSARRSQEPKPQHVSRYWLPDGDPLDFSDRGFMPDPSKPWAAAWAPNVRSYADIDEKACLVLIGEPGLGKTTALQQASEALHENSESDDAVLFIDLSATTEEAVLRSRIFDSPQWRRWHDGDHRLHLFLDTLDFALLRVETIGDLIQEGLADAPTDRLALRLACRTADRYLTLESWLQRRFGADQFGQFGLLPFTASNVQDAASARVEHPQTFLRAVITKGLQPLAMIPGTLNMLLDIAAEHGELPDSRAEVYQQGCELLCHEPAERRTKSRAARYTLSPSKRFAVAQRIAGQMILAAQASISTTAKAPTPDATTEAVLTGGQETDRLLGSPTDFEVDELAVKDTLSCRLFAGIGEALLNFRHKTYGEFLCGRWLANGALSKEQIEDLVFSDLDGRARVIPELREVASWLAALSPEFAELLLTREPAVLVRADPASLPSSDRASIVTALLAAISSYELRRFDIPVRTALPHLGHPGLADQLRHVLHGQRRDPASRETAADIAGACRVLALESDLVAIALDSDAPPGLRHAAVGALGEFATPDCRRQLVGLATSALPEDTEDELKGAALSATWPSVLTLDELLTSLSPPKRLNLYGSYKHFLRSLLVDGLQDDQLAPALRWAATLPIEHAPTDGLSDLREQLLVRSAERLTDTNTLDAFATVASNLLIANVDLFSRLALEEHPELLKDKKDRRRLLSAMLSRPAEQAAEPAPDAAELVMSSPSLAPPEDVDWAAQQLIARIGTPEESAWAALVEAMLVNGASDETIFAARLKSPVLARLTSYRYEPILIDSPEADAMRDRQRRKAEMVERREEIRAPRFDVRAKVTEAKAIWDEGDLDGFWVALAWMEQSSPSEGSSSQTPKSSPAGTLSATRSTWLTTAAATYLRDAPVEPSRWFQRRLVNEPAWAGYRALHLLATNEQQLSLIPCDIVERWAPMIVGWPLGDMSDDEFDRWAIVRLVHCAPDAAATWLKHALRRERSDGHAIAIRRFIGLVVAPVEKAILARARDSRQKPAERAELVSFLMAEGLESGWTLARRLVVPSAVRAGGPRRELAAALAARLAADTPSAEWQKIWPLIRADDQFGQDVIGRLAGEIGTHVAARLTEQQIADLFSWIEEHYPRAENPIPQEAHYVGAREQIVIWSEQLTRELVGRGTLAAVIAFDRLVRDHPDLVWLRALREQTREAATRASWTAPSPAQILAMAQENTQRWVVSDRALRRVIASVLRSATDKLQGINPQVQLLWTDPPPEPRGEQKLSDWIAAFLEYELQGRAIVVGRETQIRASVSGKGRGESIDLKIDAVAGKFTQGPPIVSVMVEVKGSWNRDLMTAMESQLVERYLTGQITQGIYVTGYFAADTWKDSDRKRTAARRHTIAGLTRDLQQQAEDVSTRRVVGVESIVLDCSLVAPRPTT